MSNRSVQLRRYTDLAAVLHVLTTGKITLLPPHTWDDKNDKNLMLAYQDKKKFKSVRALCFTQAQETYHHWKVFAPGNSGMCIVFKKQRLLRELKGTGVRHSSVKYYTLTKLERGDPPPEKIPFSKRWAYRDEKEYRLLFCSPNEERPAIEFQVPLAAIDRIVINPWLPLPLVETVKDVIKSIPDCKELQVLQSTVIDGPAWKNLAARVRKS